MISCKIDSDKLVNEVNSSLRTTARLLKRGKLSPSLARWQLTEDIKEILDYDILNIDEFIQLILDTAPQYGIGTVYPNIIPMTFDELKEFITRVKEGAPIEPTGATNTELLLSVKEASYEKDVTGEFLTGAYGSATRIRQKAETRMQVDLVNSILLDRTPNSTNRLINTDKILNLKIRNLKERLLQTVLKGLKDIYETAPQLKKELNLQSLNLLETLTMFKQVGDSWQYQDAIEKLSYSLDKRGMKIPGLASILFPENISSTDVLLEYDKNENKQSWLEAYNAWLFLTHFDEYLKLRFGGLVQFLDFGKRTGEDVYSFATKGTNNYTTWRDSDEVNIYKDCPKAVQLLITTTPLYSYGSDSPKTILRDAQYLKFSDLSQVIGKIKESVFECDDIDFSKKVKINQNRKSIEVSYADTFSSSLSKETLDLIKDKTWHLIINRIRLNPQKYLNAIFEILSTPQIFINLQKANQKAFSNLSSEDLDIIYSLGKEVFGNSKNTIFNISKEDPHNNYYQWITQVCDSLSKINFLQYYRDGSGQIKVRNMSDTRLDVIEKKTRQVIRVLNSRKLNTDFTSLQNTFEDFKVDSGIQFIKKFGNDYVLFKVNTSGDIKITKAEAIKDSINQIIGFKDTNKNYSPAINDADSSLFTFLSSIIGQKINKDFISAFSNGKNTGASIKSLMNLAARTILLRYVSQEIVGDATSKDKIKEKIKAFLGTELKWDKALGDIDVIHESDTDTISNIAKTLAYQQGLLSGSLVKSGNGNSQSLYSLSRLLGSLATQMELLGKIGAVKDTLLLTNPKLLKGVYTAREFYSSQDTKDHTDFNMSESLLAQIEFDFLGGLADNAYSLVGNGVIGMIPSVNSDKNTIGRILIDTNLTYTLSNGVTKKIKDLNTNELLEVIATELGRCYENTYNQINSDFTKLFNYFDGTISLLGTTIDLRNIFTLESYKNNFNDVNAKLAQLFPNYNPSTVVNEMVRIYNLNNRHNPIHLIDLVHYIDNKNLESNQTLLGYLSRFGIIDEDLKYVTHELFWNIKKNELIKSVIDGGLKISTLNSESKTVLYLTQFKGANRNYWLDTIKNLDMYVISKDYLQYPNLANADGTITICNYLGKDIKSRKDFEELLPDLQIVKLLMIKDGFNIEKLETLEDLIANKNSFYYLNRIDGIEVNPNILNFIQSSSKLLPIEHISEVKDAVPYAKALKKKWIDSENAYMIPAIIDGKPILSKNDTKFLNLYIPDIIEYLNDQLTFASPKYAEKINKKIKKLIETGNLFADAENLGYLEKLGHTVEINPAIEQYNYLLYLFTQEFMLSTVGSCIAHPSKLKGIPGEDFTILEEEAARFLALHKRNVSMTAAMQEFQLGTLNGIPRQYNIAIIDDIRDKQYNVLGDIEGVKPFDGATFVNPFVVYLENNSLGGAKAGTTKKLFVHFYDAATGTGGIIKTAGFGLTNDTMRNSKMFRTMMYNMTSGIWLNEYSEEEYDTNILYDYNGNRIEYKDIYFKKNGKYYTIPKDGGFVKVGKNKYKINAYELNVQRKQGKLGAIINSEADALTDITHLFTENPEEGFTINSNYSLWEAFGGMNSLNRQGRTLIPSETSIENVVEAMNHIGTMHSNNIITLDDLYLPLKHSDIHYCPTIGAVKQGASNINKVNAYYEKKPYTFMKIHLNLIGIQLDKEHHADNTELSLMTLVISACSHRGYTAEVAEKIYNALRTLTNMGTEDILSPILDYFEVSESLDDELLEKARLDIVESVVNTVMSAISRESGNEDLLHILASNLLYKVKNGKHLKFKDDIEGAFPLDNNAIFRQFLSKLNVFLTNSGIKAKIPGILSVLTPSHEIAKVTTVGFFDEEGNWIESCEKLESLENQYDEDTEEARDPNEYLDDLQAMTPAVVDAQTTDIHKLKLNRSYIVKIEVPEYTYQHYADGRFAATSLIDGSISYRDTPVSVEEFFNYITGIDVTNATSLQKQLVFKLLELNGYSYSKLQKLITSEEDVKKVILWHELYHKKHPETTEHYWDYELTTYGKLPDGRNNWGLNNPENPINWIDPAKILAEFLATLSSIQLLDLEKSCKKLDNGTLIFENRGPAQRAKLRRAIIDGLMSFVLEYIKDGRNLGEYDARFIANNGKKYSLWDLDSVVALFEFKEILDDCNSKLKKAKYDLEKAEIAKEYLSKFKILKEKYSNTTKGFVEENATTLKDYVKELENTLRQRVRHDTGALSKHGDKFFDDHVIYIDNLVVEVDWDKGVNIDPYELILPKTNMTNFGLTTYDSLHDIRKNRNFFTERMLLNFGSKIAHSSSFDIELKRISNDLESNNPQKNHIYLLDKESIKKNPGRLKNLTKKDVLTGVFGGKLYRITSSGDPIYELSSKEDTIYVEDGGAEIIVTDSPQFYLEKMHYNTLRISEFHTDKVKEDFIKYYNIIKEAGKKNKSASRWANYIRRAGLTLDADNKPVRNEKGKIKYNLQKQMEANNALSGDLLSKFKANHDAPMFLYIRTLGDEIYSSFIQSLDCVASRTPSQSMQSFMPMRIVAFDNPDVNTAYVSTAQIWLLGSDLQYKSSIKHGLNLKSRELRESPLSFRY